MDLIGSIKLIENTLGGRYSNQAQGKPAPNNSRPNPVQGKKRQPEQGHLSAWDEIQLGRNIDTTA